MMTSDEVKTTRKDNEVNFKKEEAEDNKLIGKCISFRPHSIQILPLHLGPKVWIPESQSFLAFKELSCSCKENRFTLTCKHCKSTKIQIKIAHHIKYSIKNEVAIKFKEELTTVTWNVHRYENFKRSNKDLICFVKAGFVELYSSF